MALHLGHRHSEDLDFFRTEGFDVGVLLSQLAAIGPLTVQGRSEHTLHILLEGLRLTFLRLQAPLLFDGLPYRELLIADPRDIAIMKLVAIGGRGSRKDFVDLYFYLRSGGTLEELFEMLRCRFASIDYNEYHLLKSLAFFDDAEAEPMPQMIRNVAWEEVKTTILDEVKRLA